MSENFIFELPLQTNPEQESTCNRRLHAGGHLYNACLGEALKRLDLAKQSRDWQQAKKLPSSKKRTQHFRKALKKAQFSEYSLHLFVKNFVRNCWIKDHIDSQVAQKIATRAFHSAHEYMIGKRGRPRFKNPKTFSSLEGKSNITGIRFKNGKILWNTLILNPIYDPKDRDGVEAHALNHRTKYVRLVRRNLQGKSCFYVQLIQEGKSLIKKRHSIGKGKTIGIDIGPSTIAIVGENTAHLGPFCTELQENAQAIKKLQKSLDRSRRATNPTNYNQKGIPLKNVPWKTSNRYCRIKQRLSEQKRVVAATRKTLHGTHANKLLSLGSSIKCEKLSYRSFQKTFGKSITKHAPGMFMQILRRKAANAGGQVIEFSTQNTKLSQTCHGCGVVKKKSLKERWHNCPCGITAQRDLYSAFLALHVEKESLDRSQAVKAWASAGSLLEQAVSRLNQTAKGKQRLTCFGLSQRQSRLPVKDGSAISEIKDVVPERTSVGESFEELKYLAIKTFLP